MNISNFPDSTETPDLPASYTARPATLDDLEAAATLFNRIAEEDGEPATHTPALLRSEWTNPLLSLENDTHTVWNAEQDLVGYVELWSTPPEKMRCWLRVHPDDRASGLGAYLLAWAEHRAHSYVPLAKAGAQVVLHTWAPAEHAYQNKLFTQAGMEQIRRSYKMRIDIESEPTPVSFPPGFTVRRYQHPQDVRLLTRADVESFRDHWGYVENDFETEVEHTSHYFDTNPLFEPDLSLLAFDEKSGAVAGLIIGMAEDEDNPDAGHVAVLGVLRPYRRRGLATALLKWAFRVFYQRGKRTVTLGVDAENLTGALRLYKRAGMYVEKSYAIYEKQLRAGKPHMTLVVEDNEGKNSKQ